MSGPGDIAILGNEAAVEDQLRALAAGGATDLLATIFPVEEGPSSVARTRSLLQSLVGRI